MAIILCPDCVFYVKSVHLNTGHCHRHPPVGSFPSVSDQDWCGEAVCSPANKLQVDAVFADARDRAEELRVRIKAKYPSGIMKIDS